MFSQFEISSIYLRGVHKMLPYPPLTALPNTLLIMLSLLSTFPLSLMFNPGLTKIEIFFSFFWGGGEMGR